MAAPKGAVQLFYTYTKYYYTTAGLFSVEEL